MSAEGSTAPIWTPDPAWAAAAAITRFAAAAGRRAGLDLGAYDDLLAWSVRDLDGFWGSIADFFDLGLGAGTVLADARMPGASWFPGARLNYAAQALRHGLDPARAAEVAVTAVGESGDTATLTWAQLRAAVGAFAGTLRGLGVKPGDRVAGYLPNVAETVIAFLATASIGAVWSACAQDYAAAGAAARFAQLAPVVLVAADGYRWNGRALDRRAEVTELQRLLPSLRATVYVPNLGLDPPASAVAGQSLSWEQAVAAPSQPRAAPAAFDAPLWVLFSSGTTGRPKGIVHGHGGIVAEHCKMLGLHLDLGPGRPLFWYTSTNWMMWNVVASGLLVGAPIVLYDGSPTCPDPMRLWHSWCHRRPAHRRAVRMGARPRRTARADGVDQRRYRRRQRLRREQPHHPGVGGRDLGANARCRPGILGRSRPAAERPGRRARRDPPHALHAARLLGRPGRQALPRRLLRHLARHLAARRLGGDHRPRQRDRHRPFRCHTQPARSTPRQR
jgi:acetoacetyl-CoA synthetase